MKCDVVFEGGGVKGIGLVGAVCELEKAGYAFVNLAGTSAGAIVASLLAAGYTGSELRDILMAADFASFRQVKGLARLGAPGKALHLLARYGVYASDAFELWLSGLLAKKGKLRFADILTGDADPRYAYRFMAVASDLSARRMMILPGAYADFHAGPECALIARAVRMSMSIPFYYEPVRLTDHAGAEHLIVDGGLLSNYPVWLLDDHSENPPWPTFGLKFTGPGDDKGYAALPVSNIVDFAKSVATTAIDAHDNTYVSVSRGDKQRTVFIPATVSVGGREKTVNATDFDITKEEREALFENGARAARTFLATWDFEHWKKTYRKKSWLWHTAYTTTFSAQSVKRPWSGSTASSASRA